MRGHVGQPGRQDSGVEVCLAPLVGRSAGLSGGIEMGGYSCYAVGLLRISPATLMNSV
jgi:hypothetical protein